MIDWIHANIHMPWWLAVLGAVLLVYLLFGSVIRAQQRGAEQNRQAWLDKEHQELLAAAEAAPAPVADEEVAVG